VELRHRLCSLFNFTCSCSSTASPDGSIHSYPSLVSRSRPAFGQLLVICSVQSCTVKMLTAGNASSLSLFSYSHKMLSIAKYMHVEPDITSHVL